MCFVELKLFGRYDKFFLGFFDIPTFLFNAAKKKLPIQMEL